MTTIDEVTKHYLECAIWASTDEDGEPFDAAFGIEDFSEEALAIAANDCAHFMADNEAALTESGLSQDQIGHDFWLTRNRHGAGFWDRGLDEVGRKLTDAAHVWGEVYVYMGDDGKLHMA